VFFMQAGFALIESGSVRSKNSVNVLIHLDLSFTKEDLEEDFRN
jgi:ammonia channel protein AmtB